MQNNFLEEVDRDCLVFASIANFEMRKTFYFQSKQKFGPVKFRVVCNRRENKLLC